MLHDRVFLNVQFYIWKPITAGVSQGSVLGPLPILIYINDLSQGILSSVKLFAGNTSLLSVVNRVNTSAARLNNDFMVMQGWEDQC